MKPSLLITGAGGFLGTRLTAKLDYSKYRKIYCLKLNTEQVRLPHPAPENVTIMDGDLLDVSTYQDTLKEVDTVVHMAALTGKVKPEAYFKVNAYATMLLLDRCKEAGVKNFLFISSIAVSFENKHRYFYAHSKEQAEGYVKSSGLNFVILRPTMLMGKGSPVFAGLSMLAGLPIIPVFGKGKEKIQPIHVDDMARVIRQVVDSARFHGEVLEIGGPEALPIEEFLKKTARARGKENPRALHLPVGLIAFFLGILERVVYGLLPLTVGQLASFRNHSTAEPNPVTTKSASLMKGMDEIIADSLETETPPDIPKHLMQECRVFSKYLAKQKPGNYVLEKYHQCHEKLNFRTADFHDALLLKLARIRPFFTRMADVYSRFFRPNSAVRRKLAYLMAILEVSPPSFRFYDSTGGGKLGFLIKFGLTGAGTAFHLLFSFLFLFPLQIAAKVFGKKPGAEQ
ncbi:MAG: NAD(P)-dependent oxidoreductase [bacterium]|nr:NAD(P)-dependent oxidoreductase [bacterium]